MSTPLFLPIFVTTSTPSLQFFILFMQTLHTVRWMRTVPEVFTTCCAELVADYLGLRLLRRVDLLVPRKPQLVVALNTVRRIRAVPWTDPTLGTRCITTCRDLTGRDPNLASGLDLG